MNILKNIQAKLQIKFVKSFLTLLTGSVIAEAIMFGFTPVLTRLYPEHIFGLFFTFSAYTALLRAIASLRFELALVLPKKDSHAINLLAIAFFANIILNILFLFLIILFTDIFSVFSYLEKFGIWYYFLPLSSFLLTSFEIISAWSNRIEKYKAISIGRISKSTFTGGSQISFSQTIFYKSGLFIGLIIGQAISFLTISFLTFKSISANLKYFSINRMTVLVKKYRNIVFFNTLLGAMGVLSQHLPIIMLGTLFNMTSAGLYGLATRIIAAPMGYITDAAGKVFFKKATDITNDNKDLFSFVKKSMLNLLKIAIPLFTFIVVLSFFLEEIFGEGWKDAGIYTRILLPWLFLSFLHNPVASVITVLNKQNILTLANLFLIIFRFFAIYITWSSEGSSVVAIVAYGAVSFIYSSFLIFFILNISKKVKKTY